MPTARYLTRARALAVLALTVSVGCKDDIPPVAPRRVISIRVSVPTAALELGQAVPAVAAGFDQDGAPVATGVVTWSAVDPSVAAVNPDGVVFAVSLGTTEIRATADGAVGRQLVTVAKSPGIWINEISPRSSSRGGWIELFNPTPASVDLSGWTLTGRDVFIELRLPTGTSVPAGGYVVFDEVDLPFTVDTVDAAHLFSRFGVQVDGTSWAVDSLRAVGRCPDGTGGFVTLTTRTKGTANACAPAESPLGARVRR